MFLTVINPLDTFERNVVADAFLDAGIDASELRHNVPFIIDDITYTFNVVSYNVNESEFLYPFNIPATALAYNIGRLENLKDKVWENIPYESINDEGEPIICYYRRRYDYEGLVLEQQMSDSIHYVYFYSSEQLLERQLAE